MMRRRPAPSICQLRRSIATFYKRSIAQLSLWRFSTFCLQTVIKVLMCLWCKKLSGRIILNYEIVSFAWWLDVVNISKEVSSFNRMVVFLTTDKRCSRSSARLGWQKMVCWSENSLSVLILDWAMALNCFPWTTTRFLIKSFIFPHIGNWGLCSSIDYIATLSWRSMHRPLYISEQFHETSTLWFAPISGVARFT